MMSAIRVAIADDQKLFCSGIQMLIESQPDLEFVGAAYDGEAIVDLALSQKADIVLMESTYGDRVHDPDDGGAALADVINRTMQRRGKVIIPAFALGRVEELLYWIDRLEDEIEGHHLRERGRERRRIGLDRVEDLAGVVVDHDRGLLPRGGRGGRERRRDQRQQQGREEADAGTDAEARA